MGRACAVSSEAEPCVRLLWPPREEEHSTRGPRKRASKRAQWPFESESADRQAPIRDDGSVPSVQSLRLGMPFICRHGDHQSRISRPLSSRKRNASQIEVLRPRRAPGPPLQWLLGTHRKQNGRQGRHTKKSGSNLGHFLKAHPASFCQANHLRSGSPNIERSRASQLMELQHAPRVVLFNDTFNTYHYPDVSRSGRSRAGGVWV